MNNFLKLSLALYNYFSLFYSDHYSYQKLIFMRKYVLSVLFLFVVVSNYAQNKTIDSLQRVLLTQKEDTSKVNTLIQLCVSLRAENQAGNARNYAKEALALAARNNFTRGKGTAYMNIGFTYVMQQDFTEALNYYNHALKAFEEAEKKMRLSKTLIEPLHVDERKKTSTEKAKNSSSVFKQHKSLKNKQGIAECYKWIAQTYSLQKNKVEALKYYYKAFGIYEGLEDSINMASCLLNIGWEHQMQTSFDEAINNMERSLTIWESLDNKAGIVRSSNMIGSAYCIKKNYKKALEKHLYALKVAKIINNTPLIAMTLPRLGQDYEFLAEEASIAGDQTGAEKMYAEALKDYTEALKLFEKDSNKLRIAENQWHFGRIYTKMKNYDLARDYFEKSLALSKTINNKMTIMLSYENLAYLDSMQGNYKAAYSHYKSFMNYRDSALINDSTIRQAAQAKGRYEFSKKEDSLKFEQQLTNEKLKQQHLLALEQQHKLRIKEASLKLSNQQKELTLLAFSRTEAELKAAQSQQQEKEKQLIISEKEKALEQANFKLTETELSLKQNEIEAKKTERNISIVSAFVILILALALWQNNKRKQRIYNLLEKQQMRTQIASDLHDDIGSTLTSISYYTEMVKMNLHEDNYQVKNLLEKIGNNVRNTVSTMSDIVWVVNPDNDITENLVRRMKNHTAEICQERNIKHNFYVDDDMFNIKLDMQQRKNMYLIYKEALNNALKYSSCSSIDIKLMQIDHTMQLVIKDDGKGFNITTAKDGNGLGNMKRRAEAINGKLMIKTAAKEGTTVELIAKIT
jgi:signal transduction histidine kinase